MMVNERESFLPSSKKVYKTIKNRQKSRHTCYLFFDLSLSNSEMATEETKAYNIHVMPYLKN